MIDRFAPHCRQVFATRYKVVTSGTSPAGLAQRAALAEFQTSGLGDINYCADRCDCFELFLASALATAASVIIVKGS